jgi:hypothetical protein
MDPVRRDSRPGAELLNSNATIHCSAGEGPCDGLRLEAHHLIFYDGVETAFAQPGSEPVRSHLRRAHLFNRSAVPDRDKFLVFVHTYHLVSGEALWLFALADLGEVVVGWIESG